MQVACYSPSQLHGVLLFEVFMKRKAGLVQGFGINDADYNVTAVVDGKKSTCQFYSVWNSILQRCYDKKYQTKNSTYIGSTVCKEWLRFSNFKAWMESQDWEGKRVSRTIIRKRNKVYSPNTCALIDHKVSKFITESTGRRGRYPLGVSIVLKDKFLAQCSNPFTKMQESLGYFNTPKEAHAAWRKRKHEFACQLADLQSDPRVANALRTRYL